MRRRYALVKYCSGTCKRAQKKRQMKFGIAICWQRLEPMAGEYPRFFFLCSSVVQLLSALGSSLVEWSFVLIGYIPHPVSKRRAESFFTLKFKMFCIAFVLRIFVRFPAIKHHFPMAQIGHIHGTNRAQNAENAVKR